MLALSIITIVFVFLSIFWTRFCVNYLDSVKGFQGFLNSSPYELSGVILMISIPVILGLLILVFSFVIYFLLKNKSFGERITTVNDKINANLEVVARRMIESAKLSYSSEFFKVFPMVMENLADGLTDIITRSGLTSELVISSEMEKYGNNRIVATCRIILNLKENKPDFDENFRRALKKNESLFASVENFKALYDKLLEATQRYDREKFLYSFLEEGGLGKVYLVLTRALKSISDSDVN
jgi:hypothetical protein